MDTDSVAMSGILPLVLLLVQALIIRGSTSLTITEDCSATKVLEGGNKVIATKDSENRSYLYVKPESGFLGVCLTSQKNHTACFSAEKCFPRNDELQEFRLYMHNGKEILTFGIWSSTCRRHCDIHISSHTSSNYSVVAYGPSKWMESPPPEYCNYSTPLESLMSRTEENCTMSPTQGKDGTMKSDTTTTTPITTTMATFKSTAALDPKASSSHQLTMIIVPPIAGVMLVVLVAVAWRTLCVTSRK